MSEIFTTEGCLHVNQGYNSSSHRWQGKQGAGATNNESLENTPDVTLLKSLNRASLAVANKFATKKELDLTQILRRKRVT